MARVCPEFAAARACGTSMLRGQKIGLAQPGHRLFPEKAVGLGDAHRLPQRFRGLPASALSQIEDAEIFERGTLARRIPALANERQRSIESVAFAFEVVQLVVNLGKVEPDLALLIRIRLDAHFLSAASSASKAAWYSPRHRWMAAIVACENEMPSSSESCAQWPAPPRPKTARAAYRRSPRRRWRYCLPEFPASRDRRA